VMLPLFTSLPLWLRGSVRDICQLGLRIDFLCG
jgi:hypothetical protein